MLSTVVLEGAESSGERCQALRFDGGAMIVVQGTDVAGIHDAVVGSCAWVERGDGNALIFNGTDGVHIGAAYDGRKRAEGGSDIGVF